MYGHSNYIITKDIITTRNVKILKRIIQITCYSSNTHYNSQANVRDIKF